MAKKNEVQFVRVLYVFTLVCLSFWFAFPFLVPIVLAGTIALSLYPMQVRLQKRKWKTSRAALLITAVFTIVISIPFTFFVTKGTLLVIEQLRQFSVDQKLQDKGMQQIASTMKREILHGSQTYISKLPFASFLTEEKLDQYLKGVNVYLMDFFQNLAVSIPTAILFLIVMILCTYSFLANSQGVRNFFQELFGFTNRKMDQLVGIFLRDSRQVYVSNIVTGAVQSCIVATAVYFVTGADWFLVFFVTLIFSFVPVIGAAPMALLFSAVAFFQGNTTGAIILFILSGFTGIVDNIMRPWLASFGESKAPGIVSFISVIGGALVLGFPGLFIGLLVGAIVYDTLPLFWEEIDRGETGVGRNFTGLFSFGDKSKGAEEDTSKH